MSSQYRVLSSPVNETGNPERATGLNLERILRRINCPLTEEQTWAVCHQTCCSLLQLDETTLFSMARIGLQSVMVTLDGDVRLIAGNVKSTEKKTIKQIFYDLGLLLFNLLDYGLEDDKERILSHPLENLIDSLTRDEGNSDMYSLGGSIPDLEDPDSDTESTRAGSPALIIPQKSSSLSIGSLTDLYDVIKICESQLEEKASSHYKVLCKTMVEDAIKIINTIRKWKDQEAQNGIQERNSRWLDVMRDVNEKNIKLRHVSDKEQTLKDKVEVSEFEILLMSIANFDKSTLKPISCPSSEEVPSKEIDDPHDSIMQQIRARPYLKPVSERRSECLSKTFPRLMTPMESLMEEIKTPHTLKKIHRDSLANFTVLRPSKSYSDLSTVCEEKQDYNINKSLISIIDVEESLPPMLNISQSCDGILELESSIMEINIEESLILTNNPFTNDCIYNQAKLVSNPVKQADKYDCTKPQLESLSNSSLSIPLTLSFKEKMGTLRRRKPTYTKYNNSAWTPCNKFGKGSDIRSENETTWCQEFKLKTYQDDKDDDSLSTSSFDEEYQPLNLRNNSSYVRSSIPLSEVISIQSTLAKADLHNVQLKNRKLYKSLKDRKICFSCQKKSFGFFTKPHACFVCHQHMCMQCCCKDIKKTVITRLYPDLPSTGNLCICHHCVEFMQCQIT